MKKIKVDLLSVEIFDSRKEMGEAAAKDICERINSLLKTKSHLNMIFAAAPSQNEVLESLTKMDVDWTKISAFHMDEYIGLDPNAPQGFGNFLRTRIFEKMPFETVNYINPSAKDPYTEAKRYGDLLSKNPVDIVVMGIGENGHIAFNDPPVADFSDPLIAKVVPLDQTCRMQQVHDGCFSSIDEVPTHAITLTVPTLMSAPYVFCIVPAPTKADAVYATVNAKIEKNVPSTILRTHKNAIMYLDADSSKRLNI